MPPPREDAGHSAEKLDFRGQIAPAAARSKYDASLLWQPAVSRVVLDG